MSPVETDTWKNHGVREGKEYAILTDEVTKAWSGMTTRQYKNLKGLKKENQEVAKQGGSIAGDARESIEAHTGRPVVTSENANSMLLNTMVVGMIEDVGNKK